MDFPRFPWVFLWFSHPFSSPNPVTSSRSFNPPGGAGGASQRQRRLAGLGAAEAHRGRGARPVDPGGPVKQGISCGFLGKARGKPWENPGKSGKIMRRSVGKWENPGKIHRKMGKTMGKSEGKLEKPLENPKENGKNHRKIWWKMEVYGKCLHNDAKSPCAEWVDQV